MIRVERYKTDENEMSVIATLSKINSKIEKVTNAIRIKQVSCSNLDRKEDRAAWKRTDEIIKDLKSELVTLHTEKCNLENEERARVKNNIMQKHELQRLEKEEYLDQERQKNSALKQFLHAGRANSLKINKLKCQFNREQELSNHFKSMEIFENKRAEQCKDNRRVKYKTNKRVYQLQNDAVDKNQKLAQLSKIQKTYSLQKRNKVYDIAEPSAILKKVTTFKSLDAGFDLIKRKDINYGDMNELYTNKGYVQNFRILDGDDKLKDLHNTYFGKRGKPSCSSGYLLKSGQRNSTFLSDKYTDCEENSKSLPKIQSMIGL